jgi:hypothetical protein
MPTNPTQIADDVVVKIEYTLTVDGEVLDSSQEEGPLEYLHGYDNIVPDWKKPWKARKSAIAARHRQAGRRIRRIRRRSLSLVPRKEIPRHPARRAPDHDGSGMATTSARSSPDRAGQGEAGLQHHGRLPDFDVKVIGLRTATKLTTGTFTWKARTLGDGRGGPVPLTTLRVAKKTSPLKAFLALKAFGLPGP